MTTTNSVKSTERISTVASSLTSLLHVIDSWRNFAYRCQSDSNLLVVINIILIIILYYARRQQTTAQKQKQQYKNEKHTQGAASRMVLRRVHVDNNSRGRGLWCLSLSWLQRLFVT